MYSDDLTSRPVVALIEGAAAVVGQADLHSVLTKAVETATHLTGARYGALGVIGEHGTVVDFIYVGIDSATADRIGPLPTGKGVLGALIESAKTIRLDRLSDHISSAGFPEHHPPMDSFLGVPIRLGSAVFGNFYLTEKPGGFTEHDEALVESLAVIAGSAISTVRLHQRMRKVAVVEDRERIARDLHDAIIQDLFAVGLSLQGLGMRMEDDDARRAIDDSVERLDDAITSLRRFIFGLRPPVWAERSLRLELADLIGQLAAPHDVDVQLQVSPALRGVEPATVDTAVHLVRESLSNALRHAEATTVTVSAETLDGDLLVTVADDGVGFDPEEVVRGFGLDNLATRSEQADGTMHIRSRRGEGSSVSFRLPMVG